MSKSFNFEIVIGKGIINNNPSAKNVTLLTEQKNDKFGEKATEEEVIRYLRNIKERNQAEAKEAIKNTGSKKVVERRVLRTPEAKFQNVLLRMIYQRGLDLKIVGGWIRKSISKNNGSILIQQEVEAILRGVESCKEAVNFLKKKISLEHKDEKAWIATDDSLDAQYKIDLLAGVEGKNDVIKTLYLVQVKKSLEKRDKFHEEHEVEEKIDKKEIESIIETHQEYLDALPKFIEMLNKNEAKKLTEKEMNFPF